MRAFKVPVLLVDDRRANLDALAALLESDVYDVVCVTSGREALEQVELTDFAVILLDMEMPTMSGIETAQRMIEHPGHGRTRPIIFVSAGDATRARVREAYAAGAVDFLQKPIEPEILQAKVSVFADLYRSRALVKDATTNFETEKKGAQEEARRFRLLVESVKDYAIFILDPAGYVQTWNAGAERIKGYRAHEIIGKHFSSFYPAGEGVLEKCAGELETAAREGRFEEEGWRVRKDGSQLWANVTITALRESKSGTLVGFAKVTRDLTERMRNEKAIQRLAAERAALAEKARTQEFQERFIAILGHDLRNPLSAIDMGAALLSQRVSLQQDEAASRILKRMKSSARRMTRMIEQILDLTRSRLSGGLQVRPVEMNICPIVASIADEMRIAYPHRQIDLRLPSSLVGSWDRDRLEQVFSNLLGNAIHHGDPTRPVTVDVHEESEHVVATVHNFGTPVPESIRTEIFSPFRRGERDGRTADTEGLGLGLYISREIVLGHGGTIDVTSSATEGTTFRVVIPLQSMRSPTLECARSTR